MRILLPCCIIWILFFGCGLVCSGADEAENRLNFLKKEINRHDRLYYQDGQPEISDLEYDRLRRELEELEKSGEDPGLPRFGSDLMADGDSAQHRVPMLSLGKAHGLSELEEFHGECSRIFGTEELEYWIEPKIDGVAVSAVYENGYLKEVLTRGDGERGNAVGERLVHSGCLPVKLPDPSPEFVELRGEAYIPRDSFQRINSIRNADGIPEYSNPRNLAAGTVLGKDDDAIIERDLSLVFFGWGAWSPEKQEPFNYTEFRNRLLACGFSVPAEGELARGKQEMMSVVKRLGKERDAWPYATDGLVIKLNSVQERKRMGTGAIGPRWAVAWKFPPDCAETILKSITWQMGRTGALTPVAELEPIDIGGKRIRRASLHNLRTLRKRNLQAGQRVRVELAGDVIPAVYPVSDDKVSKNGQTVVVPEECPWCHEKLIQSSSLTCPNFHCPERVKHQLRYFCEVLGLRGIPDKLLDQLVDEEILACVGDVFSLGSQQYCHSIEELNTLMAGLDKSRNLPLWRKIQSLGIPGIGKSRAMAIAEKYGSMESWMNAGGVEFEADAVDLVQAAVLFWEHGGQSELQHGFCE